MDDVSGVGFCAAATGRGGVELTTSGFFVVQPPKAKIATRHPNLKRTEKIDIGIFPV
jgi:hypothetical protein